MRRPATRSTTLDVLRGLACALLVLYHVIGDTSAAGLRLADGHWLRELNDALGYLRMPLFAFVAGEVYGLRPVAGRPGAFLLSKARRLLLPLLTVGTLFTLVQGLVPGTNGDRDSVLGNLLQPANHFWYLEALFLIFALVAVLDALRALATPRPFTLVFAVAAAVFWWKAAPGWFALNGAVYLLPFFLAGLGCRRFALEGPRWTALAAGALPVAAMLAVVLPPLMWHRDSPAALALGVGVAFLLAQGGWQDKRLAWIGRHGYPIFLFHVFFTAAVRMALHKAGVDALPVLIAAGVAAGIGGPWLVQVALRRSSLLALLLLGEKSGRRPARVAVQAA